MAKWLSALLIGSGLALMVSSPARADFRDWAIHRVIVPLEQKQVASAGALDQAAGDYCAGKLDLAALRARYLAAVDGYMPLQWLNFGPAVLFDRGFRLNFWPDSRNAVGRQLASLLDEVAASPEALDNFSDRSVAVQGLPAMERLLYDEPVAAPGQPACKLLVTIAGSVKQVSGEIMDDWARVGTLPGTDNDDQFSQALFGALQQQLELMADRKLARVIGPSEADARPRLAEAWRSQHSVANILHNIKGISAFFEADGGEGWRHKLLAGDHDDDLYALLQALDGAHGILEGEADHPLDALIHDAAGRGVLQSAAGHLKQARQIMIHKVGPALGLNVGFNSLDGD